MLRILLAALMSILLGGCSSLLYYPTQGKYFDPGRIPLKYEDLFITGPEGKKIHAWYFPSVGPNKGTFLYFHGNGENLTSHFISLFWLPAMGYSYLIFDYPGYDQSEGEPTPLSTVAAGKEVLRWLHTNKNTGPIYIYGQSLGGNIALRVVLDMKNEVPIKAVVVDGSFASYQSVGRAILAKHWLTWLIQPLPYLVLSDKYAPNNLQGLPPVPLLVIHGELDNVIPVNEGKKLFAEASEPKKLWILPEGHHGDSFFTEKARYRQELMEYLNSLPATTTN